MFEPRSPLLFRAAAVAAVIALITLVTAFDFDPAATLDDQLPFVGSSDDDAAPESDLPDSGEAPEIGTPTAIGEFIAPIEVMAKPGDDRAYIVSLLGTVAAVAADGTTTTVLDITSKTVIEGERGLLGAAFHPTEQLLYVHYSDLDGDSVVAEYTVDPTTGLADPGSERQLLVIEQPYDNHNGGELDFGPDGMLYVGVGDGGLADDPNRTALDLTSPLGKILRLDPAPTSEAAYTIPTDNPFATTADADPLVWSYGLRNPWKFSFDAATGDLWIADVGQNAWEEINRAPAGDSGAGLSFGWSAYEGEARFNEDQVEAGHTAPFATYARDNGRCSISGGVVYRGEALPQLQGWYVFGDYCTGEILAIDTTADSPNETAVVLASVEALVAVAAGPGGELFAVSVSGPVYALS